MVTKIAASSSHSCRRGASFSFFSEAISQALGAIFGGDLFDDAARQQAFEPVGQDVRGNTFGRGHEFFEPGVSIKEVADDEQGPPIAKNIQGERYRTRRTLRGKTLSDVLISAGNRHDPMISHTSLAIHKSFTCILQVLLNTTIEMTVNLKMKGKTL